MASEISATCSLSVSKGGASINSSSLSKTSDMTGVDMGTFTQAVGTSAEALAAPADVGYPAHYAIKNLDSTNFVSVYVEAAGTNLIGKLYPGQIMLVHNAGVVPGVKADTASCQIQGWICET